MTGISKSTLGIVLGLAGSLLLGGIVYAQSTPEELETQLAGLKQQWTTNQREYAKQQQDIHEEAEKIREELCALGKPVHCKEVNLDKLARAVAVAETQNCLTGVGASMNNCHGITECTSSGCGFKEFKSIEESYAHFKAMWVRAYGRRFPTIEDARRYTDNPNPHRWYAVVEDVYTR
ncbi:MAG: hypothetical protein PHW10_03870 [Candidatus Peribacteraceae bacterium]|nr:hypothetical protein [Candidatus Peribacteraceae bacterium]